MMNNKKRILHVTGAMNVGGTETMLINLYRKINDRFIFDFISYSDKEAYYDKEIEKLGGKVIRLKPPMEVGFIGAIKDIKKVIKENGPYDSVHTHMLFNCGIAMIAAYLSGIKVRVSHAHTTADNNEGFIRKVYIEFMRILIKVFSTDFLACSDGAGRYLFGDNIAISKKYKLFPNYIDYNKFVNYNGKNFLREELRIKSDEIVIGHIGRFIDVKNHDFLIDIFHEIVRINNKVKLILVGIGDNEEKIRHKVRCLNLEDRVYFLGIRDDIPNILYDIDLFILPSISEGLGLVLLEAQASKVPCLVSEAIQPEVDLGVNLVYKLNLSDGSKFWAKEALNIIESSEKKDLNIIDVVKKRNYDLDSILNKLEEVYKLELE